ncbi:MAG: HEAT repeat domain-containing protein [Candidatus Zixiibacteriota bacterium]
MTETLVKSQNRLKDISLILRDLLKVIKVVAMYPEGNPLPQSLRRSFAEKLASIIEESGEIHLRIDRNSLTCGQDVVFTDGSKEESLAGLFFDVGITSITFKEGLEVEEIYRFLDTIKRYQNAHDKSLDLANLLWEANLSRFSFTTLADVELASYDGDFRVQEILRSAGMDDTGRQQMAGDKEEAYDAIFRLEDSSKIELPDDGQTVIRRGPGTADQGSRSGTPFHAIVPGEQPCSVFDENAVDEISLRVSEAAEAMGFGDLPGGQPVMPDTALILNDEFKLSEEQEQQITSLLVDDAQFDMNESTVELLKEMLHQEVEMDAFYESVTICEKVYGEFVRAALLTEGGKILDYFQALAERLEKEKPLWAERLKDARITAGSRDRLKYLVEALNGNPEISVQDMRKFLDHFGWEALSAITDLLGDLEHQMHRQALCDFLAVKGKDNLQTVSKGIFDKRWYVVRNSITVLSQIGDKSALAYLKKAAAHEEPRVRLELVKALRETADQEALDILKLLVRDADAEVRRQAVETIVARRGQAAFEVITAIINDDSFLTLDQSEQENLLTAYSVLGGEHAIEYLRKLIVRFNLFRDPVLAFFRRAAFHALSQNKSDRSGRVLAKLGSSWRPEIKRLAMAAVKKRREHVYGGSHEHARG